jgi:opacity protein-like surface antigen
MPGTRGPTRLLRLKNKGDYVIFCPMKNKIMAALFLFLLSRAAQAGEIRAMVGPNWSKYLFSSEIDYMNRQQKSGFGIGLGWALALNRNMKLEVNALFSEKGAKASLEYLPGKTVPGIYKNASISFPVLFKYQLNEKATPYAALGPELVIIVSHHLRLPESGDSINIADNTRKIVLAYTILLGYEWPVGTWSLFAEIRYDRWLGNFWLDPLASVKSESVAIMLGGVYRL